MKNIVTILALLVALSVFGESAGTNIAIHIALQTNSVSWDTTHTSVSFMCKATIDNQTRESLTVSNLFQDHSGLSLKVTDEKGVELADIRIKRPSLEDAFIELTGKSLRE